jgi:hypothetical protein
MPFTNGSTQGWYMVDTRMMSFVTGFGMLVRGFPMPVPNVKNRFWQIVFCVVDEACID